MEPVTPEKENEAPCYAVIAGLLGKDVLDLKPENSFTDDLGADSLDALEIVMHLEAEFDIKISDAEAEEILTIGDAVKRVQKLIWDKEALKFGEEQLT